MVKLLSKTFLSRESYELTWYVLTMSGTLGVLPVRVHPDGPK